VSQLSGVDYETKLTKKQIMQNAWREKSNLYPSFEGVACQKGLTCKNAKEKHLQSPIYMPKKTHPEVNKSNI
jgi:hypothetical protein